MAANLLSWADKFHWSPELEAGQINDGRHEISEEEESTMWNGKEDVAEQQFNSTASQMSTKMAAC